MAVFWLAIIALLVVPPKAEAQNQSFKNAKVTFLSAPVNGNGITVNGSTRYFTNGTPNPANTFIFSTNNNKSVALTNLMLHLGKYPPAPSVLAQEDSEEELDIKGFTANVTIIGPWGQVTYATNERPTLESFMLPVTNIVATSNKMRALNWLMDAVNAATNSIFTNAPALKNYWNKQDYLAFIAATNATSSVMVVTGELRIPFLSDARISYVSEGRIKTTNHLIFADNSASLVLSNATTNAQFIVRGEMKSDDLTATRGVKLLPAAGLERWTLMLIDPVTGEAKWGPTLETNALLQGVMTLPYADWTNRFIAGPNIALTTNINGVVTITGLGGGGTNVSGTNFLVFTNGVLSANRSILNFLGGVTVADNGGGGSANITILGADARATNGITLTTNGGVTYISATNKFGTLITNQGASATSLSALTNASGIITYTLSVNTNNGGVLVTNIAGGTNRLDVTTNAQGLIALTLYRSNYFDDDSFTNTFQAANPKLTNLVSIPYSDFTNRLVPGSNITLTTNAGTVTISSTGGGSSGGGDATFAQMFAGTNVFSVLGTTPDVNIDIKPYQSTYTLATNLSFNESDGLIRLQKDGWYRIEFLADVGALADISRIEIRTNNVSIGGSAASGSLAGARDLTSQIKLDRTMKLASNDVIQAWAVAGFDDTLTLSNYVLTVVRVDIGPGSASTASGIQSGASLTNINLRNATNLVSTMFKGPLVAEPGGFATDIGSAASPFRSLNLSSVGMTLFNSATNASVVIRANPAMMTSATYALSLPPAVGAEGQVLGTVGGGTTVWTNMSGGGGGGDLSVTNVFQIGSPRLTNLAANTAPFTNILTAGSGLLLTTNSGVVTASTLFGASTNQPILYVSTNGTDATAIIGDITRPWRNLTNAIAASPNTGAKVVVLPGFHTFEAQRAPSSSRKGAFNIINKTNLTVSGAGGRASRLHSYRPGLCFLVEESQGIVIEDLFITTTRTNNAQESILGLCAGVAWANAGKEYVFRNNTLIDHQDHGFAAYKLIGFGQVTNGWLLNNYVENVGSWNTDISFLDGTAYVPSANFKTIGNIAVNCFRGIEPYDNDDPSTYLANFQQLIAHNVIINYLDFGIGNSGHTNQVNAWIVHNQIIQTPGWAGTFTNVLSTSAAINWSSGGKGTRIADNQILYPVENGIVALGGGHYVGELEIARNHIEDSFNTNITGAGIQMIAWPFNQSNVSSFWVHDNRIANIRGYGIRSEGVNITLEGNRIESRQNTMDNAIQIINAGTGITSNILVRGNQILETKPTTTLNPAISVNGSAVNVQVRDNEFNGVPLASQYTAGLRIESHWSNNRLGIGTNNPQATIHVHGSATVLSNVNTREVHFTGGQPTNTIAMFGVGTNLVPLAIGANLSVSSGTLSASGGAGISTSNNIVFTNYTVAAVTNAIIDAALGTLFRIKLTNNMGLMLTNGVDGQELSLELYQDNVGFRTVTAVANTGGQQTNNWHFGEDITSPISLTTNAGRKDLLKLRFESHHMTLETTRSNWCAIGILRNYPK